MTKAKKRIHCVNMKTQQMKALKALKDNLTFLPPSSTSALVGEAQSVLYEPAPSPLL